MLCYSLKQEQDRLARNAERHEARAKAKGSKNAPSATSPGGTNAASPEATTPAEGTNPGSALKGKKKQKTGGTTRKCANCGQVGHIKTNKKSVTFAPFLCDPCKLMNTPLGSLLGKKK